MVLQNGKQRDLLTIKSDAEFTQIRKLLSKNGLTNIKTKGCKFFFAAHYD
jgi:hypothetical protein